MNTHSIEITSDFICPWCFVAKTRLKRAIAQLKLTEDFQFYLPASRYENSDF